MRNSIRWRCGYAGRRGGCPASWLRVGPQATSSMDAGDTVPSPASLVKWLRDQGLVAKASRLVWGQQLLRLAQTGGDRAPPRPVVLLLTDGSAGVLVGADESRATSYGSAIPVLVRRTMRWPWTSLRLVAAVVRRGDPGPPSPARPRRTSERPFSLMWVIKPADPSAQADERHRHRLAHPVGA